MLRPNGREATIERFIGALTMALGAGAMFYRPGAGLYAILEATGERAFWSLGMLNFGCVMIVLSYFWLPKTRICCHAFACLVWGALLQKFLEVNLWGAALQAMVVLFFAASSAYRIVRYVTDQEAYAPD